VITFLIMKGRGFNELHNSQVYEGFCTGIPLPDASKVGQLIRCLVNPDDPQIYKFREEYQTDGYRARNGSPDKAYTLPSQGVTKLLESFI